MTARLLEHGLRVEREDPLLELVGLELIGLRGLQDMLVAPGQQQLDDLIRTVDQKPPLAREHERRHAALRGVGEEDVVHDVRGVVHVADVEDVIGEGGEEHARADVVFHPLGHFLEDELAERLIPIRPGDDHDVRGRRGRDDGDGDERPQELIDADAAGLHGDELAVAREPAERDEQAEQHGHRNADRERLRQEEDDDLEDDPAVDALGDDRIRLSEKGLDGGQERQQPQGQQERQRDLAHDVPVEDSHRHPLDYNV